MAEILIRREGKAALSRARIVIAAAELFADRGFEGTSIRDIAAAVSMTTASLYYHFASKEDLYVAVHGHCMAAVTSAVESAIVGLKDPWERLEAAAGAHCESMLGAHGNSTILSNLSCLKIPSVREALIAQRDAYDRRLQTLIDDLPLGARIDRKLLRLQLLGSLNFMPNWYRDRGRLSAEDIGRTMVRLLRDGLAGRKSTRRSSRAAVGR